MMTMMMRVMITKLATVIAVVPAMDFFKVSMVMCRPPSKRMIASVTCVKSGPTTPNSAGRNQAQQGSDHDPYGDEKEHVGNLGERE